MDRVEMYVIQSHIFTYWRC